MSSHSIYHDTSFSIEDIQICYDNFYFFKISAFVYCETTKFMVNKLKNDVERSD